MCRHRPLTYCEIFCETGILAPVEEWGHFVAASRKIGNFDKWVVIGWRSRMSKRGEVREIICKPGRKCKVQLAESSIQPRNGIASGRISCSPENTKVCVLSIFHLATPASPLTENICLTGLPPLPDLPLFFSSLFQS